MRTEEEENCFKCASCLSVIGILILIITLLSLSITKIESTEVGVEYVVNFAYLNEVILKEGLNTHTPGSEIIKWPITYQTAENKLSCNSRDGIRIELDISFQYIPVLTSVVELTKTYKNFENYRYMILNVTQSSIRHTCSDFLSDEFQTNRTQVRYKMETDILDTISLFKSNVIELQLRNIDRPQNYEDSIALTENARTGINLAINQRQQQLTAANTELTVNYQNANKTLDLANTEANVIKITAQYESEIIYKWYRTKNEILKNIKNTHNLSILNLLSYIGNGLFNTGKAVVSEPSQLKY